MRKRYLFCCVCFVLLSMLPTKTLLATASDWYVEFTGTELQGENPPLLTSIPLVNGSLVQDLLLNSLISPFGIAVSPDGVYTYAVGSEGTVFVIRNGPTPQLESTLEIGGSLFGIAIAPDGRHAYVTQEIRPDEGPVLENVVRIDIKNGGTYETFTVGEATSYLPTIALAPDGTYVYVVESGAAKVWRITLENQEIRSCSVGATPQGIASTPDGAVLIVACMGSGDGGSVSAISTSTFTAEVVSSIDPSAQLMAVAIDRTGRYAYIPDTNNMLLLVIDISLKSLIRTIDLKPYNGFPYGIFLTPDGAFAYIANSSGQNGRALKVSLTASYEVTPISFASDRYYDSVVVTPDQAPTARFTFSKKVVGKESSFDAMSSSSPVGSIASYQWDFGDGSVVDTTEGRCVHRYTTPGVYFVTLTVMNSAGTSLDQTFTGQTVSNNGAPSARTVHRVHIYASRVQNPSNCTGKIHNRSKPGHFFLCTKWDKSHSFGVNQYQIYKHNRRVGTVHVGSRLAYTIHFHAPFKDKKEMSHQYLEKIHEQYRVRAVTSWGQKSYFRHPKVSR